MNQNNVTKAFHEWVAVEGEWHAEIERVYGKNADDARYDERGKSTPELKRLYNGFHEKRVAHHAALDAWRTQLRDQPIV